MAGENNQAIEKTEATNGASNSKYQKYLKWLIFGILGVMIAVLLFGAGMLVGANKAGFSYKWAINYQNNFGGPRAGFFVSQGPQGPNGFISGHGSFGEIVKIDASDIVIGGGEAEKVVIINSGTILEKGGAKVTLSDLKVGDNAMVIGSPNNQGQIVAKLIRIFNQQSFGTSSTPLVGFTGGGPVVRILR